MTEEKREMYKESVRKTLERHLFSHLSCVSVTLVTSGFKLIFFFESAAASKWKQIFELKAL